MKNLTNRLAKTALSFVAIAGLSLAAYAQNTTTWIGSAGDNEWTNGLNWDDGNPPDNATGTNHAIIPSGFTVNYDQPMVAAAFGGLTNSSVLNVSTNGFNCDAINMIVPGQPGKLFELAGGVINITGNLAFCSNSAVSLAANSSLSIGGSLLVGCGTNGGTSSGAGIGLMTNNGANLTATSTQINPPNGSLTSLLIINGGTNNLGNVTVKRCSAGSGGFNALGTEGLVLSNGIVTMSSLDVGGNNGSSFLTTLMAGGLVTNNGTFVIRQATSGRSSRFIQNGGIFVTVEPNVINPNPTNGNAFVTINGGTNITGGIQFSTAGSFNLGTANFTNSANVYIGAEGITSNATVAMNCILNNNGLFGATGDWIGAVPMTMSSGTFTFQAADLAATPHNITINALLRGSGSLAKTGLGTLTLNGSNTYSGNTFVNAGTLAIGATGSISNTLVTFVGSGATLDVSAVPGGWPLGNAKTLQGFGTVLGTVNVASGGIINPGSNAITGTLTVGTLVENGGVLNNFFTNGSPPADFLVTTGDLDVTNVNTIQINGAVAANSVYPLIHYGGNFNGSTANFSIIGATGSLSNNATTKTLYLVTAAALRNPTNIVWAGNPTNNIWDTTSTSNWLNNGSSDFFVPGDNARFDSTGAIHPLVNVPGSVTPGSVTVDTTSNYTFFGTGNIGGPGSLMKTNSGTLTVLTTNSYSGQTIISGGVIEVTNLSASGTPSSVGAASSDPTNLVITDSVLRYLATTSTTSDHGITLGDIGGTLDLPTPGVTLSLNGVITGAALTKTGAGALTLNAANSYTNVDVQGGTLSLQNAAAAGSGSITNENGTTLRIVSALTVPNPFDAEGNVVIDLNNTGGDTVLSGAWSGSGTVLITNQQNSGRIFTMGGNGSGGGNMDNFTGTINVGNCPGIIRFNNGGGSPNTGNANLTLNLGTSTASFVVRNGGIFVNIGALLGGPGTTLAGRATGTAGTVVYNIGGKGLATEFDGTIKDGTNATGITLVGGSLKLTGTNTYTSATTVNAGTLQVDGQITTSAIILSGGGGGVLAGAGILGGAVDIGFGCTLIPGDGLGQLAISNSLTLEPGSTNIFEVSAASGTNASIVGLAGVTYGGNLIVTNVGGTFTAGQTFTLFVSTGFNGGTWDSITLPPLGAGLAWDTSQLAFGGTISVISVAPPGFTADFSSLSGGVIAFHATNGHVGAPVSVLSSTNITVPLTNWTALTNGNFDGSGNFDATNAVDKTLRRQFFIILEQ